MKPSLLDPSFRYTPAVATDLRKTFARVRREQRQQAAAAVPANIVINFNERSKAK